MPARSTSLTASATTANWWIICSIFAAAATTSTPHFLDRQRHGEGHDQHAQPDEGEGREVCLRYRLRRYLCLTDQCCRRRDDSGRRLPWHGAAGSRQHG